MELSEIREKINICKYSNEINRAIDLQNKMRFYTIPFYEPKDSVYFAKFKKYVEDRLNNVESASNFFNHINYPIMTCSVATECNNAMFKMFEGEDKNEIIEIGKESNKKEIIKELLNIDYLKNEWFEKFKSSPNDIYILFIDLNSKLSIEYFQLENLKHIEFDKNSNVTELILKQGEKIIVCEPYSTSIYVEKEGNIIFQDEQKTNLEYPACDFVSNYKIDGSDIIRGNYFYSKLGDFNKLLFNSIIDNIHDSMAYAHEIEYSELGCDYEVGDVKCQNGYLYANTLVTRNIDGEETPELILKPLYDDSIAGKRKKCPVCNNMSKSFGGKIHVSTPSSSDGIDAVANMYSWKFPEISILEHTTEKITKLSSDIINSIIGQTETLNNAQQHNEIRILSTYESKQTVLTKWKYFAELFYTNSNKNAIKLLFPNSEFYYYFNLGFDFYLNTETQILDNIQKAKDLGILGITQYKREYISTKYQTNEKEKQNLLIYLDVKQIVNTLESLTISEVLSLPENYIEQKNIYISYDSYWNEYVMTLQPYSLTEYYDIFKLEMVVADFSAFLKSKIQMLNLINTTNE